MRRVLLVLVSLVVGLLGLLVLLVGRSGLSTETLYVEAAKATLNLMVALLITGILSFVLAQRAARQASKDEETRVLTGALQELKAGYERIQVARFHLSSQRTGSALIEHIGAISEARAQLHKVQRERFILETDVDDAIQRMLNYLTALANEYKVNYAWLAESALAEERIRKQVLDGTRDKLGPVVTLDPDDFKRFTEFTDDSRWPQSDFHRAYQDAKGLLQDWLDQSDMWTPQRPRAGHSETST